MLSTDVIIKNDYGISTYQAIEIAFKAEIAKSGVWLLSKNERANAKSIISLLMLRCRKDSVVTVKAEHSMDIHILDNIKVLLENDRVQ